VQGRPDSTDPHLRLYYREGCHLCEELAALLYRGWPQLCDDLEWIDVDRSPELVRRYGLRVPVLVADGAEVCDLKPDPDRLQAVFGAPANPV
jgi:hypothetical protein